MAMRRSTLGLAVLTFFKSRSSDTAPRQGRGRYLWPLAALVLVCFVPGAAPLPAQEPEKPLETLAGVLVHFEGDKPAVKSLGKEVPLSAQSSYLYHTLLDKRLVNREVRIEGNRKADGSFEAVRLFTVHGGKLFRVRFFCEVCNIAALEPGRCVCCQRPTELQEIPVGPADHADQP